MGTGHGHCGGVPWKVMPPTSGSFKIGAGTSASSCALITGAQSVKQVAGLSALHSSDMPRARAALPSHHRATSLAWLKHWSRIDIPSVRRSPPDFWRLFAHRPHCVSCFQTGRRPRTRPLQTACQVRYPNSTYKTPLWGRHSRREQARVPSGFGEQAGPPQVPPRMGGGHLPRYEPTGTPGRLRRGLMELSEHRVDPQSTYSQPAAGPLSMVCCKAQVQLCLTRHSNCCRTACPLQRQPSRPGGVCDHLNALRIEGTFASITLPAPLSNSSSI